MFQSLRSLSIAASNAISRVWALGVRLIVDGHKRHSPHQGPITASSLGGDAKASAL